MITEKVRDAYEELAEAYDRLIDDKPHNAHYDRPNTLSLVQDVKGKRVLDAACGPGKYAEILMSKGAEVVGIDLSPKMIDFAKSRNGEKGTFEVHDLNRTLAKYNDGTFDVVLCALAMHYIENWNPVIQEFARVLKSKGKLVLSFEHPFFTYSHFNSKNYFATSAVNETWSGFGKRIKMHCYKRSLQDCLLPVTDNGFYIDKLIEPLPTEEFKKKDPKHYKELMSFPAFMCLRAIKRI